MEKIMSILELASQLGILFVISVFITYFGKLILLSTPTIDWKTSTLVTLAFWLFWIVRKVFKRE